MEQKVVYLLMVQIFISLKEKTLAIPLCLGNVSNHISADNMKKTGFYGYVYNFSVYYDAISVDDILIICKYLMKNNNIE